HHRPERAPAPLRPARSRAPLRLRLRGAPDGGRLRAGGGEDGGRPPGGSARADAPRQVRRRGAAVHIPLTGFVASSGASASSIPATASCVKLKRWPALSP